MFLGMPGLKRRDSYSASQVKVVHRTLSRALSNSVSLFWDMKVFSSEASH